jgi:four helix bundle protein
MSGKGFRELEVWQLAMILVEKCYEITRRLPVEERYGLSGQIRRAAVSIPANVAEGHNRRLPKPYRNHVNIALGSQAELETLLELTVRLKLLDAGAIGGASELVMRVGQMLYALQRSIKSSSKPRPPR